MKRRVALAPWFVLTLFPCWASAGAGCPDFSGVYQYPEGERVQITHENCESVTETFLNASISIKTVIDGKFHESLDGDGRMKQSRTQWVDNRLEMVAVTFAKDRIAIQDTTIYTVALDEKNDLVSQEISFVSGQPVEKLQTFKRVK